MIHLMSHIIIYTFIDRGASAFTDDGDDWLVGEDDYSIIFLFCLYVYAPVVSAT